jgi:hypothetical protein
MDEHQQPTFFDARGRLVPEVVSRSPDDDAGLAVIARANAPLAITSTTAYPRWDGDAPNYDWIIQDLCRADHRANVSEETFATVRPSAVDDPSEDRASPRGADDLVRWPRV